MRARLQVFGKVCVGDVSNFSRHEPTIVVASHRVDVVLGQEGAAAVDVTGAVSDVTCANQGIDTRVLQVRKGQGKQFVLCVHVADDAESGNHRREKIGRFASKCNCD